VILAAADYADDPEQHEPPRELELMFECRNFPGSLYEPGGLADQPAGLLRRMRAAYNAWGAVCDWRSARNKAKWCEGNPHDWKIVQLVLTLRETPQE